MRAPSAGAPSTLKRLAVHAPDPMAKRPRYLRDMIWSLDEPCSSPTAKSSLFASPMPLPADSDFILAALDTLNARPDLFAIVTPINVSAFEDLLRDHPNRPFVVSVLRGLREGFWPGADTSKDGYPLTWDFSHRPLANEEHIAFVQGQVDEEVRLHRFSPPFGPDLLPGMYSTPIHVVPKPHSTKLRLIVDHSTGSYSLNSMIDLSDTTGVKLDGMRSLGLSLLQFRRSHGDIPLVMFKSDVSQAYRRLPMHPLWQLKQIVTAESKRYVDRCNNFGGRGSAYIWVSFVSLVIWIATTVTLIDHLKVYMDDSFSFELEGTVLLYEPYGTYLPRKQALLLQLWDRLGIPHEAEKQVFGRSLTIIGFEVDPNAMTVSIPHEKKTELLAYIRDFAVARRRHTLRNFQRLAGTVNWLFNVFPLLKPGLSAVYQKMSGKEKPLAQIYVNSEVVRELSWLAGHMDKLPGVVLFESLDWGPGSGDDFVTIYTDASSHGLAYWFPDCDFGFQCATPPELPVGTIFFAEALAVCSAIHAIPDTDPLPRRVVIYTDNSNTVDIFNSLRASKPYNRILMSAVDVLITHNIDLRVYHVPGHENVIADALSCFHNDVALQLVPGLIIDNFTPPQDAMGAGAQ
jgi:hypothetical protein